MLQTSQVGREPIRKPSGIDAWFANHQVQTLGIQSGDSIGIVATMPRMLSVFAQVKCGRRDGQDPRAVPYR